MQIDKNTPYYIAAMLLFFGLKFGYSTATTDDVWLLLAPTSKIVALLTSSQPEYSAVHGFLFQNLHITIEKSCSGFNFWLINFVLFLFQTLKAAKTTVLKLLFFPFAATICYLLTVVVNASRILFAIKTNAIALHFGLDLHQKYAWLHETEGAIIYLTALIGFYLIVDKNMNYEL
jgi:exosortase K